MRILQLAPGEMICCTGDHTQPPLEDLYVDHELGGVGGIFEVGKGGMVSYSTTSNALLLPTAFFRVAERKLRRKQTPSEKCEVPRLTGRRNPQVALLLREMHRDH